MSEGKIEAISILHTYKASTFPSAEITDFQPPKGVFKDTDKPTFKIAIRNTGKIDWIFWVKILILDPIEVRDEIIQPIKLSHSEESQFWMSWPISKDAPAGTYSMIVSVYDGDPRDPNSIWLDGEGKPCVFMIDKQISYIEIVGGPIQIASYSLEGKVIHIHIINEDLEKLRNAFPNMLFTRQKLYKAISLSQGVPEGFPVIAESVSQHISESISSIFDMDPLKGPYDLTILQWEDLWPGLIQLFEASPKDMYFEIKKEVVEEVINTVIDKLIIERLIGFSTPILPPDILLKFTYVEDSLSSLPYLWYSELNLPNPASIEILGPRGQEFNWPLDKSVSIKIKVSDPQIGNPIIGCSSNAIVYWEWSPPEFGKTVDLKDQKDGIYVGEYIDGDYIGKYYILITITNPPSSVSLGYIGWSNDSFTLSQETVGASLIVESKVPSEGEEVEIISKEDIYSPEMSVETDAKPGKVIVKVSSDVPKGRTIVINIDYDTLPISELDELLILYDGMEIGLADDYADVLNPYNEDVPEYLVLMGARGIQVLLSIPYFSTHTIEISKLASIEISMIGLPSIYLTNIYFDDEFLSEISSDDVITVNFKEGTYHIISVKRDVLGGPNIRYVCQNNTMNVSSQNKVEFEYFQQFYITVDSSYGSPQGEGWYDTGSRAIINIEHEIPMEGLPGVLGAKRMFSLWSGDITSNNSSAIIVMDEPKQVSALWREEYSMIYFEAIAVISVTCVILFLSRKMK